MNSSFYAGTAMAKVTPPLRSQMNGEFFPRTAKLIHDELYVKAIFLKKQKTKACLVIVDNCSLPFELIEIMKFRIGAETGLEPSNILIAATHAHSCGSAMDSFLAQQDSEYCRILTEQVIWVLKEASTNIVGACVAFGKTNVPDYIFCRRYKMKEDFIPFVPIGGNEGEVVTNPAGFEHLITKREGIVDTELSFMAIKSKEEKLIAVLANYSLHYVGDFDGNTISADYFGFFAKALEEKISKPGFMAIMSNGTSANANNWDFLNPDNRYYEPFEKSRAIANDLAEKIYNQLPLLKWNENADLDVLYEEKLLPVEMPSVEVLNKCRDLLKEVDFSKLDSFDNDTLQKIYAREIVLLNDEKQICKFPVQAFKIGDGIIGGLPGEVFGSTGIDIKNAVRPLDYFSISMANAYVGYIVPMHEMELGGYETWLCRNSKLNAKAETILKQTMIAFAEQLKRNATCQ